jgi:crossover junction endodeoxyribonuclease RuvC
MSQKPLIILGIDPGSHVTGYGIIASDKGKAQLLALGTIDLHKLEDHYQRLAQILHRVDHLIQQFHPDCLAIEAPFYAKNVQSMLKLGRAQGMAIAAALQHKLPVFEYSPRKVKQSVTGNGNAAKEQVAAMLVQILRSEELPKQLDATDGLAVAICHHFSLSGVGTREAKYSGWQSFLKANPGRAK